MKGERIFHLPYRHAECPLQAALALSVVFAQIL